MIIIRIPHHFARYQDPIKRILRHSRRQIPIFSLRSQELRFCSAVLTEHSNWWVYRCNQKKFIGDFVMVDMSSPHQHLRRAWILELKFGHELEEKQGFQLRNRDLVVRELMKQNIITQETTITCIHSSGTHLLSYLRDEKNKDLCIIPKNKHR